MDLLELGTIGLVHRVQPTAKGVGFQIEMDDRGNTTEDVVGRRLSHANAAINIAGGILLLVYLAAVIDEATGGALRARYEARREAWRNRLARREEYILDVRRVEYEAWLVLQDEESTDE